jgi:hypothetical protein
MNINEFKEKFGHLKDSDVIQVSCDHPLHNTGELKPMKVQSVKRKLRGSFFNLHQSRLSNYF